MTNRKSLLSACLAFVTAIPFLAGPYRSSAATDPSPANSQIRIVTVVKRTGLVWFDRMQKGIEQFAAKDSVAYCGKDYNNMTDAKGRETTNFPS
jgi:ABC-type sugar transport system substrate-binding protein